MIPRRHIQNSTQYIRTEFHSHRATQTVRKAWRSCGNATSVYALLSGKETDQYKKVLEVVKDAVEQYWIQPCAPVNIMTDLELAIINAATAVFPTIPMSCCYFYLGQSVTSSSGCWAAAAIQRSWRPYIEKLYTHVTCMSHFPFHG